MIGIRKGINCLKYSIAESIENAVDSTILKGL